MLLKFIPGFAVDESVWEPPLSLDCARDISPLVRGRLRGGSEVLIGWSMGAEEAVDQYLNDPEKVKALVLVSATPKFLGPPVGISSALLRNLEKKIEANFERGLRFFYSLMFLGGRIHPLIKKMALPDKEKVFADLEHLKVSDWRNILPEIKVPVLLIHGESDKICLPAAAAYLHDGIAGAEIKIFERSGHAPFLDWPDKFNRVLKEFILTL
ncbi:alpha/beta fold hydrolase [Candidatus Saganbacteria bacterium]|nr:alpha/beta fold hydrolase [Candidatus Saganbacteria bacterium]